jgi:hypothetical protein
MDGMREREQQRLNERGKGGTALCGTCEISVKISLQLQQPQPSTADLSLLFYSDSSLFSEIAFTDPQILKRYTPA